jgi:hypothetical protein
MGLMLTFMLICESPWDLWDGLTDPTLAFSWKSRI